MSVDVWKLLPAGPARRRTMTPRAPGHGRPPPVARPAAARAAAQLAALLRSVPDVLSPVVRGGTSADGVDDSRLSVTRL